MTPEAKARQLIDDKLAQAGWVVQDMKQLNLAAGAGIGKIFTDLITLVRFAIGRDSELRPFGDQVDKRFQTWIFRHNAQRITSFTAEQTEWLRLMKDHLATSGCITRDYFDLPGLSAKGGLQKAWAVLGNELDGLMGEMNVELVA